jgi:hypothetical protein
MTVYWPPWGAETEPFWVSFWAAIFVFPPSFVLAIVLEWWRRSSQDRAAKSEAIKIRNALLVGVFEEATENWSFADSLRHMAAEAASGRTAELPCRRANRFCQNSVSGQNSINPHLLKSSINVLPTLPFHVRIQEKT